MEELIEELTKVTPDNLSEEGLKLFNKINEIIDRNKELEKENEELLEVKASVNSHNIIEKLMKENIISKTTKEEVEELLENSIPKSKIQEKIEELNKRIEKYREYVEQGIETDVEWVDNVADRQVIRVLQELLEECDDNA